MDGSQSNSTRTSARISNRKRKLDAENDGKGTRESKNADALKPKQCKLKTKASKDLRDLDLTAAEPVSFEDQNNCVTTQTSDNISDHFPSDDENEELSDKDDSESQDKSPDSQ